MQTMLNDNVHFFTDNRTPANAEAPATDNNSSRSVHDNQNNEYDVTQNRQEQVYREPENKKNKGKTMKEDKENKALETQLLAAFFVVLIIGSGLAVLLTV